MKADKNFGLTEQEEKFIEDVIKLYPTVVVDFGNAYTLTRIKSLDKAKAVILSYEDMYLMHDITAQVLFGGSTSSGHIPIISSEIFAKNSGVEIPGGYRFK